MNRSASFIMERVFNGLRDLHDAGSSTSMHDLEDTLQHIGLIEHLFPSWTILGLNIATSRAHYLSDNSKRTFGFPYQEMLNFSADDFFSHIHPEDVEAVLMAFDRVESIIKAQDERSKDHYRFISNFRYRRCNGQYIHLCCEKTLFQANLFLLLFRDTSEEKPFTHVRLQIQQYSENGQYHREEYVPRVSCVQGITGREAEILQLIKAGLSTKEIAAHLYISPYTVRNHRSRLFEKTHTKNMVELLNFASQAHLI